MLYSQNGWSANNPALMATYTIPNTGGIRVTLRQGDASVVLLYLLEQYHRTVEHLTQADTGGYNPRSIIGASTISNHGSGTAVDARWNLHPRGTRGTFTAIQKTAVRIILAFINTHANVIRWGEDYRTAPVDGMHFELIGTPTQVTEAADRIQAWRAGKAAADAASAAAAAAARAATPPRWPRGTAYYHETDTPKYSVIVESWQARMRTRGWTIDVDGRYGHKSADVAVAFQREKGLARDRLLGPATFAAAWTTRVTR